MQLTEKYRPRRLAQIVGQDRAVQMIRSIMDAAEFDREAFLIQGPTGTGKTSIAWAMARLVGCDDFTVDEIDGDQCSVDRVRAIGQTIRVAGWAGSGWKAYIVNEAHAMTARAVQAWLTLLERLPAKRMVIFTTTESGLFGFGGFSQQFIDRTIRIELTKIGLREPFARLAMRIAGREGLNGRGMADYKRLLGSCHNSMRAALRAIQRGEMKAVEHSPAIKKMIAAGKAKQRRQSGRKKCKR